MVVVAMQEYRQDAWCIYHREHIIAVVVKGKEVEKAAAQFCEA